MSKNFEGKTGDFQEILYLGGSFPAPPLYSCGHTLLFYVEDASVETSGQYSKNYGIKKIWVQVSAQPVIRDGTVMTSCFT